MFGVLVTQCTPTAHVSLWVTTMSCAVGARLAVPVARRVVLVRAQRVSGITARASSRITGPVLTRCKQKDALHRVRTVHLSVLAPRRGLAASTAVATNAKSKASATSGASAIVSDTDKPLYEAVVVVAGGIEDDGSLPAWVTGRLDFAAAEYERHQRCNTPHNTPPPYIVLSGSATPHKPPPVAKGGFTLHESTAMASYLLGKGIPGDAILKDTSSMDTIGNAYFSLTTHAVPKNWKNVLIVTSKFHMARTRAAFEWVWGLENLDGGKFSEIAMAFHATDDFGLAPETVAARLAREQKSERALRANREKIKTITQFHHWLYTTHMCYAVGRQHEIGEFEEMKNDPALKSY